MDGGGCGGLLLGNSFLAPPLGFPADCGLPVIQVGVGQKFVAGEDWVSMLRAWWTMLHPRWGREGIGEGMHGKEGEEASSCLPDTDPDVPGTR